MALLKPFIPSAKGNGLHDGKVYFGVANKDPKRHPVTTYKNTALTLPLPQPIITKDGYLSDGFVAVDLYIRQPVFSVRVLDAAGNEVFYKASATLSNWTDGIVFRIDDTDVKTIPVSGGIARNQHLVNKQSVTPFDFGLIGDGTEHLLSERYKTLAQAKLQYPRATSLSDTIDGCALQAFFDYCHENFVPYANASCNAYINKPLTYLGSEHATNLMFGNLLLTTEEPLDYLIRMTGLEFQFLGAIHTKGGDVVNPRYMVNKCGLVIGDLYGGENVGQSSNLYIHSVSGNDFSDCVVHWGDNSHFSSIGNIRGSRIGSSVVGNDWLSHEATFSSVTHIDGDIDQQSILVVDSLPPEQISGAQRSCTINGQLYNLLSVDRIASTVSIYPRIPKSVTSGVVSYHYGTSVRTFGGDTSNLRIGTLQNITVGHGAVLASLYGVSITTLITEACGVGVVVGGRNSTTIGNNINSGYFETNTWDVVYAWGSTVNRLPINNTIGLDPSKIVSLFDFRLGHNDEMAGGSYALFGGGDININGLDYNSDKSTITGDINSPEKVIHISTPTDIILSADNAKIKGFGKRATSYILSERYETGFGVVTFEPPALGMINGSTDIITIDSEDYIGAVLVTVMAESDTDFRLSIIANKKVKKGTTLQRPTAPDIGQRYYDTTLAAQGKPIEWNGLSWVDAIGNIV